MGWTLFTGGVQQWRQRISTVQPCTIYPPQQLLVYIEARCNTKQCGCRKHWLACKRACGNCQYCDCDSVYCVLSQFPRIMDMKPKHWGKWFCQDYALYYDRKTHLSVNKTVSNAKHLQMCTSSTLTNVYHDNLSIAFYDGHVIDHSSTTSLDTSDSVTYLKCSNILMSINKFRV